MLEFDLKKKERKIFNINFTITTYNKLNFIKK